MKLSIIIPLYNAEKYIDRCLQSILNSGVTDYEIICVDDGSTDNSLQILKSYEERYEHIHALTQKNSFAGIARNHGMRYAKGEYLHFMDVDDEVFPNAYTSIIQQMDELSADMIKVKALAVDTQTKEECIRSGYMLTDIKEHMYGCLLSREEVIAEFVITSPAPWTMLVRKEYVQKNGMEFNGLRCANDRSFFANVISHTDKLTISEEVLVRHYINNNESLVGVRHKYFECNIESCKITERILQDVPKEIRKIIYGYEILDAVGWYIKLDKHGQEENRALMKSYLETVDFGNVSRDMLCDPQMDEAYKLLGKTLLDFLGYEYHIKNKNNLRDLLDNSNKIIVYGAGQVADAMLRYLCKKKIENIVESIMVSNCNNNVCCLYNIPVVERKPNKREENTPVIIATLENVQRKIMVGLAKDGYKELFCVSEELYAELKADEEQI